MSLFACMFLCLVKKLLYTSFLLCAGRSTKEGLNHPIHRAFLRKNQETLQILVCSLILLNLVKNVAYSLFIALSCVQSALNYLIHRACLRKNYDTSQILIFGLIILNLVKKLCQCGNTV